MPVIPSGIIVLWPGAHSAISGLSGWSRETALDDKFPRGRTSGNAGNGGSATHNHNSNSHSHGGASHDHSTTSGGNTVNFGSWNYHPNNQRSFGNIIHTHTQTSGTATSGSSGGATATWQSPNSNPEYYEMIAIVSDGTPTGFPDDCVVWYNAGSAPSDWTQHSLSVGKFIKPPSSSTGDGGGTGGGSHTHTADAHTHTAPNGTHDHTGGTYSGPVQNSSATGTGCECGWTLIASYQNGAHTHVWDLNAGAGGSGGSSTSPVSGGTNYQPPYHKLLGIQNTSGADNWLEEAIVMWLGAAGSPPDDWTLCNGGNNESGNATPDLNGKHILMAASGGGDNGAVTTDASHTHSAPNTHPHTQSHGHVAPGAATMPVTGGPSQGRNNRDPYGTHHGHTATNATASTTSYPGVAQGINSTPNTEPAYRTVAFLSSPEEPSAGGFGIIGANF